MVYSLVRATGIRPSENTLREAFRAYPWLLDIDVATMMRSGYGIVAERLPLERGQELGRVLTRHGVPNKVVAGRTESGDNAPYEKV